MTTPIADIVYGCPLLVDAEIAVPLLAKLRSACLQSVSGSLRQQIAAQELLLALIEARRAESAEHGAESAVRETIEYIHRRYRDPLTVGDLLRRSGIGRWQYGSVFRSLTGLAPLDYLNELRLDKACELMKLTDDPLREIARSVGFRDEYYFSRRFSRFMGVP